MNRQMRLWRLCGIAAVAVCGAACGKNPPAAPAAPAGSEAQKQAEAMAAMHHDDAPVASPAAQQSVSAGSVERQSVAYGTVGGKEVKGYLARPAKGGDGLPGVILFHEWWGLNDNIRSMADQLAAQGYVALAADLYGGQVADKPEVAQSLMQQALGNFPAIDANIQAAYDYLRNTAKAGRIGTIGWCFGGGMSYEAGQVLSGKVDATVIYYGFVNDKPEQLARIKAPVLGFFGGKDQSIPVSTVQGFQKGLEALGQRPRIRIYPDAGHAFANPSGKNYRKDDAEDAWKWTLDFLGEHLKS